MNTKRLGLGTVAGAVLGAAMLAAPAAADDCGVWGWGGGISFSYSSGFYNDGCFSIGYSTPVYHYASGPRYHYHGGYRSHYRPSYRTYYYDDCRPRYYYRPSYRQYYRPSYRYNNYHYRSRYDDCGYYWSGGYALDGYYVSSTDSGAESGGVMRYRSETYAGDPNFAPAGGYKVARTPSEIERAEELDPAWAGDAIAMLRKGEPGAAVAELERAAYTGGSGVQHASLQLGTKDTQDVLAPADELFGEPSLETLADRASGGVVSDMGGGPIASAQPAADTGWTSPEAATANPEAVRMLGLALIADGRIDEGAAKVVEAYRLDPTLASTPIDERLFPSESRLDVRDLVRRVSVRANRTNAPEAWFALGVLMQAEDRDSVALDMVLKASAQGLDQSIVSPMADSLRRVVYGRG